MPAQTEQERAKLRGIKIPTIIIKGETELIKDTLSFSDDLSPGWKTKKEYRFEPEIDPFEFQQKPDSTTHSTTKMVFLQAGFKTYFNAKAFSISKQNKLLNFSLNTQNYFYDDTWNRLVTNIFWMPKIKEKSTNFDFGFANLRVSKDISTTINNLNYFQTFFLEKNQFKAKQIELFAGVSTTKQQQESFFDIDVISSPVFEIHPFFLRLDAIYLKQYPNFKLFTYRFFENGVLKKLQLSAFKTQERFAASLGFVASANLPKELTAQVKNEPQIGRQSRKSMLLENQHQKIDVKKNQKISVVNLTASLSKKELFSMYNRFVFTLDETIYKRESLSDIFYSNQIENVISNRLGATASSSFGAFSVATEAYWQKQALQGKSGEKVPFEPAISFNIEAEHRYKNLISTLGFDVLGERYDDFENKLENVFLLNLSERWNIRPNLQLSLELGNLLDKAYAKYPLYPKKGFEAFVGISFSM